MFPIQELRTEVCEIVFMRHEYLMSSKVGNPAKKDFRHKKAPTVGPGIKSTGARMHL